MVKIVLAATYKKEDNIFFLMDEDFLVSKELTGISYQESNSLFEKVFGYYPYPFSILQQIAYVDDLTEQPLLIYYTILNQHEIPLIGKWVNFETLTKNNIAFSIYGKCIVGRTWYENVV